AFAAARAGGSAAGAAHAHDRAPEPGLGAGLQHRRDPARGGGPGHALGGGAGHGAVLADRDRQRAAPGEEPRAMTILLFLIPVSLVLLGLAVWAFRWAVRKGQFENLDAAAIDILRDDSMDEAHDAPQADSGPAGRVVSPATAGHARERERERELERARSP